MIQVKERDFSLLSDVLRAGGPETLAQCFRCGACSAICPVGKIVENFDPRVIVHSLIWGLRGELLDKDVIWYCSECGSCVSVCPMDVKPMEVIKALKSLREEDPEVDKKRYILGRLAKVEAGKCIVCLTCVRSCPFGAPFIREGYAEIDSKKCRGCGICVVECPARAIKLEPSPEMIVWETGV